MQSAVGGVALVGVGWTKHSLITCQNDASLGHLIFEDVGSTLLPTPKPLEHTVQRALNGTSWSKGLHDGIGGVGGGRSDQTQYDTPS